MSHQLERDVRFLKIYAIATTVVMLVGTAAAFKKPATHEKFTEIDVERINVMEPDGKYRLVISNRPRSIGPIYKGQPFGYPGGGRPGFIFFNDEGTENGGFTFEGKQGADGKFEASTHMSFDQFNQDQVLNLDYRDNNGKRFVGISMLDRANVDIHDWVLERDSIMKMADTVARVAALKRWAAPRNGVPLAAQRVFIGRSQDRSAILNLSDPNGKSRLRLVVDSLGAARIEFLDADGKVTSTVGDSGKRGSK
ncbi:MAG: hypothetical protein ABJD07_00440 [Gemmatimonadaceae bacterium]